MSRFCEALSRISEPPLDRCRDGMQALRSEHRRYIRVEGNTTLTGSVDLDDALKEQCPQAPRWDHGLGVRRGNREQAIWVEVHPAGNARDVRAVLEKAHWLNDILNLSDELRTMSRRPFYWIASGRNTMAKSNAARRLLAQNAHLIEGPLPRVSLP